MTISRKLSQSSFTQAVRAQLIRMNLFSLFIAYTSNISVHALKDKSILGEAADGDFNFYKKWSGLLLFRSVPNEVPIEIYACHVSNI